jgi:hypothetical protein
MMLSPQQLSRDRNRMLVALIDRIPGIFLINRFVCCATSGCCYWLQYWNVSVTKYGNSNLLVAEQKLFFTEKINFSFNFQFLSFYLSKFCERLKTLFFAYQFPTFCIYFFVIFNFFVNIFFSLDLHQNVFTSS